MLLFQVWFLLLFWFNSFFSSLPFSFFLSISSLFLSFVCFLAYFVLFSLMGSATGMGEIRQARRGTELGV